jgi:GGDEF domain-containing protein
VLIEVASRMVEFGDKRHQSYRLGGDEFAMVLYGVHSEPEVQHICAALSQQFIRPFDLHNGHKASMSLSIGFALAWENVPWKHYWNKPTATCTRSKTSVQKQ